ncbi:response regulator receiver domain [Brevundimonas sp.]|uniref:response regulator receiver domain n=1 Tax=Brevundimonas sp. TaxID=1871086 RepID=UPI0039E4EFC6
MALMIDLNVHYAESAQRFLQTAIVIDDQAMMGPVETIVPVKLETPTGSLFGAEPDPEPQAAIGIAVEERSAPSSATLNAKILSQAFLDQRMICGLYRPDVGEDRVSRASGAAGAADIVVVDWHLETGNSRPAKEIILRILQNDFEAKGRLRLIAIYTSQAGREAIATELLAELEHNKVLQGRFTRDGSDIGNTSTRIVVLNKRTTPEAADRDEVVEERLPERLITEFAKLSEGVVPSFALASVAAVRQGAHHVLSQYTANLDGAFIAHRCGIPHPDDSKSFAVDLITSELRNLIEVENVAEQTLNDEVAEAWLQAKIDRGDTFRTDRADVPADRVLGFVRGGSVAVKESAEHQTGFNNPDGKLGKDHKVTTGTLARVFYPTAAAARDGVQQLARLSTFQREPHRTRSPQDWAPKLALGTVVQQIADGVSGAILLCVQPRCDSVRLSQPTAFPFQTAGGEGQFNLVVRDAAGVDHQTWVNLKPRDAVMIRFIPHPERCAVFARPDPETGRFVFEAEDNMAFVWLGDLIAMKAQRWVSELGSRVQGVGMDELEWLRQAGEGKIRAGWT